MKKLYTLMALVLVLLLGIACGGGGGSSAALPVLPEGQLYLFEEGMDTFFEGTSVYGSFNREYMAVTEEMDSAQLVLPANLDGTVWAYGVFLFLNVTARTG